MRPRCIRCGHNPFRHAPRHPKTKGRFPLSQPTSICLKAPVVASPNQTIRAIQVFGCTLMQPYQARQTMRKKPCRLPPYPWRQRQRRRVRGSCFAGDGRLPAQYVRSEWPLWLPLQTRFSISHYGARADRRLGSDKESAIMKIALSVNLPVEPVPRARAAGLTIASNRRQRHSKPKHQQPGRGPSRANRAGGSA